MTIKAQASLRKLFFRYSILLLVFVGIIISTAGYFIILAQRDAVTRQINLSLQLVEQVLNDEIYQTTQSLRLLQSAFIVSQKDPSQKLIDLFSHLTAKILTPREIQYNAYFALEPELAQRMFKKKGYIITTHRNASYYGKPEFYQESTFQRRVYTNPSYQKDLSEVWYHVAKKSKDIQFTGIYYDKSYMEKWLITGAIGLYDGDKFKGMIGVDLLIDEMNRKLNELLKQYPHIGVLLFDENSQMILSPNDQKLEDFISKQSQYSALKFNDEDSKTRFRSMLNQPNSQVQLFSAPSNSLYLASKSLVAGTKWRVVIYQPLTGALKGVQDSVSVAILLLLATLVVIAFAWNQLKKGVLLPIQELQGTLKETVQSSWHNERKNIIFPLEKGLRYQELKSLVQLVRILIKINVRNQEKSFRKLEVARLQAVHSSKMAGLGQMASGIAHEINNPLSIIVGRLPYLKKEIDRDNKQHEKADEIINGIERIAFRIAKIIRSLRSFSREASNDPFEEIRVSDLIEETLDLCEQQMSYNNISIRVKIFPPTLTLECQGVPISQVLINLLSNASDAILSLKEKWVEIEVRLINESIVQFRIQDSGTGLPEEVASHIMEPFFTTKQVGAGVGLGLSISKGIVESHRGRLYLDRNEPNTTFVMEIPQIQ